MNTKPNEGKRVVILGAAGRDFHNFNVVYREDAAVRVVAFTATQIPGISGRRYPAALAGPFYPDGIPIEDETDLEKICHREHVSEVVFAYSDVPHATVMHLASRALAAGADFLLLGPDRTMLPAGVPVIAISAIRTGCGKSQTARWLGRWLRERGLRVAVLRHPMPYGDLERQCVQRFASRSDLDAARCTTEEREEYEPHLAAGNVVFAGVDYQQIIERAEREADVIVWDGGNNDFPLVRPDLHIAMVDALRPGQAAAYHPGEAVLRMADAVVVNKIDAASAADAQRVIDEVRAVNSRATIVRAASPVRVERCGAVFSRRAWRRNHKVTAALLSRAVWRECPACKRMRSGEYWGRVIIRGTFAGENRVAIRQRILNVAERAQVTQPERRLVSAARDGNVLEVLTTSQKLAHRIVRELKKAFRGRVRYEWSDDGSLFAVWERDS